MFIKVASETKVFNFVHNNVGGTINNVNEIYRPDWNKVKEVLRGNRPISDLGCN